VAAVHVITFPALTTTVSSRATVQFLMGQSKCPRV
jgi:hypothetical protein